MLLRLHCHGTMYRSAQGTARQQRCLQESWAISRVWLLSWIYGTNLVFVTERLVTNTKPTQIVYESV